jgi:YVTN family beta-propeller protein
MRRNSLLFLAAGIFLAMQPARPQSSPIPAADYIVARSWRVGGNAAWDTLVLSPSGSRLFITRTDHVDVVDTSTGRLTASIPHTPGVHSVAFAPELQRGYTSNGRSNTVTVFELDTSRVLQEINLPSMHPDAILYVPQHNYVITGNRDSSDLSVIDAGAMRVIATVALPGHPEAMVADGEGHIFVNLNEAPGLMVMIDGKTLKIKRKWPLKDCANPTGLAFDNTNHRLFSVCANQALAVTDSISGRSVARVVIGRGADAVGYDPDLGMLFSSNGIDGNLTVIHQDSADEYRVLASVTTQLSARTLALDPLTHRIFLAAARFGPPPPATEEQPQPRANLIPDTFAILVVQPK